VDFFSFLYGMLKKISLGLGHIFWFGLGCFFWLCFWGFNDIIICKVKRLKIYMWCLDCGTESTKSDLALILKVMVHDYSISGLDGCIRPFRTHPSRSVVDLRRNTWHTMTFVSRAQKRQSRICFGRKEPRTNLDNGSPYPKPAIGALKSLA